TPASACFGSSVPHRYSADSSCLSRLSGASGAAGAAAEHQSARTEAASESFVGRSIGYLLPGRRLAVAAAPQLPGFDTILTRASTDGAKLELVEPVRLYEDDGPSDRQRRAKLGVHFLERCVGRDAERFDDLREERAA